MKQIRLLISLISLAISFSACNNGSEEKLLREVMQTSFNNRPFEVVETSVDGKLILENSENEYSLAGTHRYSGKYLVLNIVETSGMATHYLTGIFSKDDGWQPLFSNNLVFGKLDTIVDLNGDQRDEIIINEYDGGSAEYSSVHALFAAVDGEMYNRIGDLYPESSGSMVFVFDRASVKYVTAEGGIDIVVDTEHSDIDNWSGKWEEPPIVKRAQLAFRWRPPELVRLHENATDKLPPPNLAEAQRELDELLDEARRAGLLKITYEEHSEFHSLTDIFYCEEFSSNKRFRYYDYSGEGGVFEKRLVEYGGNEERPVRRAMIGIAGLYDPGVFLYYDKDGNEHWVSTGLQPDPADGNRFRQVVVADPIPRSTDNDPWDFPMFLAEAERKIMAVISDNLTQFAPGKEFTFIGADGETYKVDSLLWENDFVE